MLTLVRLVKSSNMTSARRRNVIGRFESGSNELAVDSSLVQREDGVTVLWDSGVALNLRKLAALRFCVVPCHAVGER